jgi:hypothetical protein
VSLNKLQIHFNTHGKCRKTEHYLIKGTRQRHRELTNVSTDVRVGSHTTMQLRTVSRSSATIGSASFCRFHSDMAGNTITSLVRTPSQWKGKAARSYVRNENMQHLNVCHPAVVLFGYTGRLQTVRAGTQRHFTSLLGTESTDIQFLRAERQYRSRIFKHICRG